MTPTLEQVVAHVLARLDSSVSRWIIAIAGIPGAGKSTLAARLTDHVNRSTQPNTLVALGMDGFHLTKAELSRFPNPAEAFARRGAPWTFDAGGCIVASCNCVMLLAATMFCGRAFSTRWAIRLRLPMSFQLPHAW